MKLNECIRYLSERDRFLLVTHVRPDGDTLASAAALCIGLRRAGKTAYILKNPETTDRYKPFVEGFYAPEGFAESCTISVDMATMDLAPRGFKGNIDLCVDHHLSNTMYADKTLLIDRSSCGEVVYELLLALNGSVGKDEALLLYIAVSTDTGCFAYGNTNANTLRTASELVDAGADNGYINKLFFRTAAIARIKLEGLIYSGIAISHEGRAAIATLTLDMLSASGANEDDCEDLASLPGRIEGVKTGILIREMESGTCKVSVRTTREISAGAICAKFGGGGHAMAAGCTVEGTPARVAAMLSSALDGFLA